MRWTVDEAAEARLDRHVADRLGVTRSQAARLIAESCVLVDGVPGKKSDAVRPGVRVEVVVPEPRPAGVEPEAIPLRLVYEDDEIAVIDKPAGLVVHPAPGHRSGTLVNALLHHLTGLSGIGGELRPGIVHRLDRDTSGLLLVAKTDRAHERLSAALARREVKRAYLVACWGHTREPVFSVDAPLGRHPKDRKRRAVVAEERGGGGGGGGGGRERGGRGGRGGLGGHGRPAVTHFERLERWRAAELLRARLETGRTHQIRVHLQHIGHPVVGDRTYGAGGERAFSGPAGRWARELARRVSRQFLHAAELELRHPAHGGPLRFESPLPDDLAEAAAWARTPR
ncbi:MAG: RluA family pseudouridine synthase [Gemmatimonadota bacterium]